MNALLFILGFIVAALATTLYFRELYHRKRVRKANQLIKMLTMVMEGMSNEIDDLKKTQCHCDKCKDDPEETVCVNKEDTQKDSAKKTKAKKEA